MSKEEQGMTTSHGFQKWIPRATNAENATNSTNAEKATVAQYADDDTTKGTIEERLSRLGFKEGSVTLSSGIATNETITRQGNYVIIDLTLANLTVIKKDTILFTVSDKAFLPKNPIDFYVVFSGSQSQGDNFIPAYEHVAKLTLNKDGQAIVLETARNDTQTYYTQWYTRIVLGYEAEPITE